MTKERPLLCAGDVVRAILEGRKKHTRRPISKWHWQPGDRLWVRETFSEYMGDVIYRATYPKCAGPTPFIWHPSIHMPRWASRITLEITNVRAEKLQDISEEDAISEGVELYATPAAPRPSNQCLWKDYINPGLSMPSAKKSFETLWDSLYAKDKVKCWSANPWVWAIEFKKVEHHD